MSENSTKVADSTEKYCSTCGNIIKKEAEICVHCGVRQKAKASGNKVTAGVLAILLGGIGGHKFYLGKVGMGILYLLFCWTYIPALIALIEGIRYLVMSDEDFNIQYSK